jgi:hypothetical protein
MSANEYALTTRWRVKGAIEEIYDIISDVSQLSRWWPSVYLRVDVLAPGDEHGVGQHVRPLTKGWLPYTLRWEFHTTQAGRPSTLALKAQGDLEGTGLWTLEQNASWVEVVFVWRVRVEKFWLRCFSFLFKPIFAANQRWAMAKGDESLKRELARRRGKTVYRPSDNKIRQ